MALNAWRNVPLGPPDAILGITEAFRADPSSQKINLGVGAYRDDSGNPFVLSSVKRAEERLLKSGANHEYTGIAGVPEFLSLTAKLALGGGCSALAEGRVAVVQSISGTGALRLAGEFIRRFYNFNSQQHTSTVYIPTPTWGNHPNVFRDSGLSVSTYRYLDAKTNALDWNGMREDVAKLAPGSVLLLHACAHNPTGIDPTAEQWSELSGLAKQRQLLCLFDMAYQGFASGDPEHDALSLRKFISDGNAVILCQSFAKNMGLYGERAGAVSVICSSPEEKEAVMSQLRIIVRPMYSNPPIHGAKIVATVLGDPELHALWLEEVRMMASRIISMRTALRSGLEREGSKRCWRHITDQIGMFCYTGLGASQVEQLTEKFHVYLTRDGRISIAGINAGNVEYLAKAIHAVTKE